ncbi:acetate--CoA ligase alpha subunit [Planctomycetota bacterium]
MKTILKDIESLMNPSSVAVVGATDRSGSVGQAVFGNILSGGFQGSLYPVNPKAKVVQGVKAYANITDIPNGVDLAVIIVPAKVACSVLDQAGQKQVKGAIVISAGFKEVGGEGVELERRLKEVATQYGIRLIGPNCLGLINNDEKIKLNASFATKMPQAGNIGFISQSGALCTAVLDYAAGREIGFSKFVSFGNKADVNETDLLNYLRSDQQTDVILMYLEDITHGRAFLETAREVTWLAHKPILAIKSGCSAEGARAAASHTGSLAGSDTAYDAIFKQSGIVRVESVDELFNHAIALSKQPIPKGNRIAIVTNAGGPGIMATDAAVRHELKIASFSEKTKQNLKTELPPTASIRNPVDIIGDATHQRYEAAIRHVLKDDNVDGAIIILTPQAMTDIIETAEIVPNVANDTDKPVLCSFMGTVDVSDGVQYLQEHGIPNYTFPEAAVRSMAAMAFYSNLLSVEKRKERRVAADRNTVTTIIKRKLGEKEKHYMPENEANEILQCYGFPVLKSILVKDLSKLDEAIEDLGFPVAMKVSSADIIHKFDVGGVKLGVETIEQARKAFGEIVESAKKFKPLSNINGIIVERMAQKGAEVILGAVRDLLFGPICMFGMGGKSVEVTKDVTFQLAPMWESSAENMIRSIKGYGILRGAHGAWPYDIEAIGDCILRLSQMVAEHPEIAELDINPLIVYPRGKGCVVADSRILLANPGMR